MKKPSIVVGDLFKILCQFYYVLAVQFTLSKIFVLNNSHVHYATLSALYCTVLLFYHLIFYWCDQNT